MTEIAVIITEEEYSELRERPKKIPGTVTPIGWIPPEDDLPFEDWVDFHTGLEVTHDAINFVMGDSFNFGEHRYGEKYSAAIATGKLHPGSYRNIAWVALAIPMSCRSDNLSWTHHSILAKYDLKVIVRLLKIAERYDLSVRKLNARVIERWERLFDKKRKGGSRGSREPSSALPLATHLEIVEDVMEWKPSADPYEAEDLARFIGDQVTKYAHHTLFDWKKFAKRFWKFYRAWLNRALRSEHQVEELKKDNQALFAENLELMAALEKKEDAINEYKQKWHEGVDY